MAEDDHVDGLEDPRELNQESRKRPRPVKVNGPTEGDEEDGVEDGPARGKEVSSGLAVTEANATVVSLNRMQKAGVECPYMDTINRNVLDFDFEKVCSISLENHNVYACLVCGKYFQGRGRNSNAYFHSLDQTHHIFVNLDTEKVYCLPDGYEIIDSNLEDIQNAIHPKFSPDRVQNLDKSVVRFRALDGNTYLQGVMGMNNLHETDYVNTVLQALLVIVPMRDFFLLYPRKEVGTALTRRLGELMRKVYNPRAFRAHVSPHEFMQEVVTRSEKKFKILEQSDPIDFLAWLLNTLQADLADNRGNSVIKETFQGEVLITTEKDVNTKKAESTDGDGTTKVKRKSKRMPYFFLSLDLPPRPLFKDAMNRKLLPQVPLHNLLMKFNGAQEHHIVKTGERRTYRIEKLPTFLVMHIKRFKKNNFFIEKNPTIVPFPAKNLEMSGFLPQTAIDANPSTKYDLVAAIVHEGQPEGGTYTVNVRHPPSGQWFQIQDLNVKETLPQLVTLAEAHILIYEAQK